MVIPIGYPDLSQPKDNDVSREEKMQEVTTLTKDALCAMDKVVKRAQEAEDSIGSVRGMWRHFEEPPHKDKTFSE